MSNHPDHNTVALSQQFTDVEIHRLRSFRSRFQELWANFDDLRKSGVNLSGDFHLERSGVVRSDIDLGVSRFRIKGFLVDYRHFHGQEEPSNFLSVLKVVQRRCRDQSMIDLLAKNRDDWINAGALSGWHNDFTLDEVVDALFKEEVFHTKPRGKRVRVRLDDVAEKMSSSAMWYEITYMAYSRMLAVRNLNWILEPIFSGRDELRLPGR